VVEPDIKLFFGRKTQNRDYPVIQICRRMSRSYTRNQTLISLLSHISQRPSCSVSCILSYLKPNPETFCIYFLDVAIFMKVRFDTVIRY
jgi:hypothetical protein